jgi:hypothetical protein
MIYATIRPRGAALSRRIKNMPLHVGFMDKVNAYDAAADGPTPPIRSLQGPSTQLGGVSGIALDHLGNLYVSNTPNNTVTVYDPGANGDAAPIRVITGPGTGLDVPGGVATDSVGNLYVLNIGGIPKDRTITVYGPGAAGNSPPIRTLRGIQVGDGNLTSIAVDLDNNLYLAEDLPQIISVYPAFADGQVNPIRTITGFNIATGMDFDGGNNLYVADGVDVQVYSPLMDVPVRTFTGFGIAAREGATDYFDIAVDPSGIVYAGNFAIERSGNILNFTDGRITVFAAGAFGSTAPISAITGLGSGYGNVPTGGMAIDKPRTRVKRLPLYELVATLLGGITVDGGGIAIIGGIPHRIGPWSESVSGGAHELGDIVTGLAIEQLAINVRDRAQRDTIRGAALTMIRAKAEELLAQLPTR